MEKTTENDLTSQWEEQLPYEEVSIQELDDAVAAFVAAREDYDAKKKISNEADAECKLLKRKLVELLNRSGKSNWEVDGLGKAIKTTKFSSRVPKDIAAKKQMLQYFRDLGPEVYLSMVSVNSATLNAYINQEIEHNPEFKLPGVEDPVGQENISFRRK